MVLLLTPLAIQHLTVRGNGIDNVRKNKISITVFFLLLTVLVMLRHRSVGSDTETYIYLFKQYSNSSWNDLGKYAIESGFVYLNKIVSIFSDEPHFFLAIIALITSAMIYPTYKRLCIDSSLTIVLFCTMSTFVMMFSGIRQMLAIGIGFVAYEFVRNKKLVPFILVVFLATVIHTSAFILAFMYPLYYAKITKKWLLAVVPSLAIVFVLNRQIFHILALVLERYTDYDASTTQTGAYMMLILFVLFAIFSFLIPDEETLGEETIGLRNFLLLSLVIQMFAPLHTVAMRMNYYYIIFIPLLLPKIIEHRSERWGQVATVGRHVMVVFFLGYFFFSAYTSGALKVFPYHFFWENVL